MCNVENESYSNGNFRPKLSTIEDSTFNDFKSISNLVIIFITLNIPIYRHPQMPLQDNTILIKDVSALVEFSW